MYEQGPSDQDLAAVVKTGFEGPLLDYKAAGSWAAWGNKEKAELIRDITAMANGDAPGYLVLGVAEASGQWSFDGVSDEQAASFDPSSIREKAKEYFDPEPQFSVHRPIVDGRVYVLVRTAPFQAVPHICRKSYGNVLEQSAVYVRSEGAQTIKVQSAESMRRLVDRATQNMADSLVARIQHLVGSTPTGAAPPPGFEPQLEEARSGPKGSSSIDWERFSGYREVAAHPSIFGAHRFPPDTLLKAAEKADVLFRGWPFIFVDPSRKHTYVAGDAIETIISHAFGGYEEFETWQLRRSGLFYHRSLMHEEANPNIKQLGDVLDFIETLYHVSEAVASLWRLYAAMGVPDEEEITIQVRYTGCDGRRLTVVGPGRAGIHGNVASHMDEVRTQRRTLPLGNWRASDAQVASVMCTEIFHQFNWTEPNTAEIDKIISGFIAKPSY